MPTIHDNFKGQNIMNLVTPGDGKKRDSGNVIVIFSDHFCNDQQ